MMTLPGAGEWLIILGVALLFFGPSRLPQLGGAVGQCIKNFKKGIKQDDGALLDKVNSEEAKTKV